MNQIATRPDTSINSIGVSNGVGGASIAPQNLGEVVRFAEVMCKADIALPKHLRGNAGACMAVALQAMEWNLSPFAVASKSYAVNGAIAYEAQLIAAVVNTRSGIKGRLKYFFEGEGSNLTCRVVGILDDEECEYVSPTIGSITTKNSPLWKSDPQQQLGYFSARSWARRHCPEVILGVYDREEVEQIRGSENARDVTPSLAERLKIAKIEQHEAPQTREGFDPDFVTRETAALTGEADSTQTEPHPQSSDTSTDEGSDEANAPGQTVAATNPPADEAGPTEEDAQASETSKADHGGQSASSSALSDEDRDWLKEIAKMLWAATGVGEQDLLTATFNGARDHHTPENISKAARDRGNSIYQKLKLVCFGEKDPGDALTEIALTACVDAKEIA